MDRVRIDKWLWAARFFKTRSAATDAVAGGHVRVNGARAKPSREVAVGDRLEIRRSAQEWTVHVRALADRRGPATAAAALYEETPQSAAAREQRRLEAKAEPADRRRPQRPADEARPEATRRSPPRSAAPLAAHDRVPRAREVTVPAELLEAQLDARVAAAARRIRASRARCRR